jgi:hypothetical protein
MPWINLFSRAIRAGQSSFGSETEMQCEFARSISCSAWPAATSTFFGVQPRFGQVPPRSRSSTRATDIPAARVGPVTAMPALPPPSTTTSNLSVPIYFAARVAVIDWTTAVAILN